MINGTEFRLLPGRFGVNSLRVSAKLFIADVTIPTTVSGFPVPAMGSQFWGNGYWDNGDGGMVSIPLDPAAISAVLSPMAALFTEFKLNAAGFHYRGACATTQNGKIVVLPGGDPETFVTIGSNAASHLGAIQTSPDAFSFPPWSERVDVDISDSVRCGQWLYQYDTLTNSADDLRWGLAGGICITGAGLPPTTTSVFLLGSVFLSLDFDLREMISASIE